jgi:hypothetical protein
MATFQLHEPSSVGNVAGYGPEDGAKDMVLPPRQDVQITYETHPFFYSMDISNSPLGIKWLESDADSPTSIGQELVEFCFHLVISI